MNLDRAVILPVSLWTSHIFCEAFISYKTCTLIGLALMPLFCDHLPEESSTFNTKNTLLRIQLQIVPFQGDESFSNISNHVLCGSRFDQNIINIDFDVFTHLTLKHVIYQPLTCSACIV